MLRLPTAIVVMLFSSSLMASEVDWARLTEIVDNAKTCNEASIELLIDQSVNKEAFGADESAALSEANEQVFLNCPILFLRSLGTRSDAGQERLVQLRFGTFHDPWVLGAVLRRLVHHPEVGDLVRRRFAFYLDAEVPDVSREADDLTIRSSGRFNRYAIEAAA